MSMKGADFVAWIQFGIGGPSIESLADHVNADVIFMRK